MSTKVTSTYLADPNPSLFGTKPVPKVASFGAAVVTKKLGPVVNINGATQTNPVVVSTLTPHGFVNGDTVFIQNVTGMTPINNGEFIVANATLSTFQLTGVDGTGFPAYIAGGIVQKEL